MARELWEKKGCIEGAGYVYLWEFVVKAERVEDFFKAYGPGGDWEALFSNATGYIATECVVDRGNASRFVTIDYWETEDAWRTFREAFAKEFEELDARCQEMTVSEREVGRFFGLEEPSPVQEGRRPGTIEMDPIGFVRNDVREPRDDSWGAVVSRIELRDDLEGALQGLDEFSHAVVVYLFDRGTFDPATDLVRRPRGRADLPRLGILAQRARHRPNRIGVSTVAIESVGTLSLTVRGLDAIDGSPVLDIKPHVPEWDAPGGARVAAWVQEVLKGYF